MRSTRVVLLVLLAVCVGTCRAWGDDVVEDAKAKAEEAKKFASEAMHDAEKETRSWADWAQHKFSKGFGVEEDDEKHVVQNIKYKAEDAASGATDTMKSAASGASEYASQKATDAKDAVAGAVTSGKEKAHEIYDRDAKVIRMPTDSNIINNAKDTMGDTYEDAKQKMYTASDTASSMAHNAKEHMDESIEYGRERAANAYDQGKQKMDMASENFYDAMDKASDVYGEARHKVKGAMDCGGDKANDAKDNLSVTKGNGRDKVAETFDQAKQEVSEAYASAKNTLTEEAKAKYEAAKEKASDATGDFGAKMRNSPNL